MSVASVLDTNVLVLNKLYMAVRITTVRRAFVLLFREMAEVVSVDDGAYNTYDLTSWVELSRLKAHFCVDGDDHHEWVRTPSVTIRVPRIVRLLFYDKLPRRQVRFNRRNIYARDGNRCQYCGRRFSTHELSLDHIVPRSRGGRATWGNIVCACTACNVRKGGRLPREAGMTLIRKPAIPRRSPVIHLKLKHSRYRSWKEFLDNAYWSVELT